MLEKFIHVNRFRVLLTLIKLTFYLPDLAKSQSDCLTPTPPLTYLPDSYAFGNVFDIDSSGNIAFGN